MQIMLPNLNPPRMMWTFEQAEAHLHEVRHAENNFCAQLRCMPEDDPTPKIAQLEARITELENRLAPLR